MNEPECELKKIFDQWSGEQTDSPEIKFAWSSIEKYLDEHCCEATHEWLINSFLNVSKIMEQQAFYAGYRQAFRLWTEISDRCISCRTEKT